MLHGNNNLYKLVTTCVLQSPAWKTMMTFYTSIGPYASTYSLSVYVVILFLYSFERF